MFIRIHCCFLFPFDLYLKSVYLTWAENIFARKLRFGTSWIEICPYFSVRIYCINWIIYHQKYPKFHVAIMSFDFFRSIRNQLRLFALLKSLSVISIEIWKIETGNVIRYLDTIFSFFRSICIFVNVFGKMIAMLRSTYIFQLWLLLFKNNQARALHGWITICVVLNERSYGIRCF